MKKIVAINCSPRATWANLNTQKRNSEEKEIGNKKLEMLFDSMYVIVVIRAIIVSLTLGKKMK